jgi:transcriptional regulator with XRE-family HTH domain
MARNPKAITPLRLLRKSTGLTQKEFADLVGIKIENYNKLERGLSKLTRQNLIRIYHATGVWWKSLDPKTNSQPLINAAKKPYSREFWNVWRKYGRPRRDHDAWLLVKDLLGWTHFLCDVARKEGKLWDLHSALAKALDSCGAQL